MAVCPGNQIHFCHLRDEPKIGTDALSGEGGSGSDPTSSVHGEQPTVEVEVSLWSSDQRLTELQVVSVEEVRRLGDDHAEHTIFVAEERQSADSEDNDVALSHFLGQHANFFDDSGI